MAGMSSSSRGPGAIDITYSRSEGLTVAVMSPSSRGSRAIRVTASRHCHRLRQDCVRSVYPVPAVKSLRRQQCDGLREGQGRYAYLVPPVKSIRWAVMPTSSRGPVRTRVFGFCLASRRRLVCEWVVKPRIFDPFSDFSEWV